MYPDLSNYNTLIQLAATFNFALVVASNTNFFKSFLRDDIFKVDETKKKCFEKKTMVEYQLAFLNSSDSLEIGNNGNNKTTKAELNRLKESYNKLKQSYEAAETDIECALKEKYSLRFMEQSFLFFGLYLINSL